MGRARATTWAGFSVFILLCTILLPGCSPETRYKLLRTFFDGVPDPNAPSPQEAGPGPADRRPSPDSGSGSTNRRGLRLVHKPYAEMQCGKCHNLGGPVGKSALLVKTVRDGLCRDCHKEPAKDVPFVHGPVYVNACTECHEAHESRGTGLLLRDTRNVCVRCHRAEDLSRGEHHTEPPPDSDAECIRCHRPHGGDKRYFLQSGGEET